VLAEQAPAWDGVRRASPPGPARAQDVRRQMYTADDDRVFFDWIQRELRAVDKRLEDGRACLAHLELALVNLLLLNAAKAHISIPWPEQSRGAGVPKACMHCLPCLPKLQRCLRPRLSSTASQPCRPVLLSAAVPALQSYPLASTQVLRAAAL